MITRMRVDGSLPQDAPEPARMLGRCAEAGLPTAPAALLLGEASGDDTDLVGGLGPLRPGRVDLVALGTAPYVVVPGLPVGDGRALAAGIRTAFSLGGPVLVQSQVPFVHAGRAALRADVPVDAVLAVEGYAHEVDDPGSDVRQLGLPLLRRRWQRPHRGADAWRTPLPPWGMRLSQLLRDVRRVLPGTDLEVEWADDGRVCRVLRLRRAG